MRRKEFEEALDAGWLEGARCHGEKQMTKQDVGNGETMIRGVSKLHGRFTAHTFSQTKTFKTRKGAVSWLRHRGYDENGARL